MSLRSVLETLQSPRGLRWRGLAWGWAVVALLVAGVLCQLFIGDHHMFGDDLPRWHAIEDTMHGKLPGAKYKYSIVMPLFATPFWMLDQKFKILFFLDRFNTTVVAVGLLGLFLLLRKKVEPRTLGTFLVLMFYASMFPHHLIFFYGEIFSAIAIAVGITSICTDRNILGWFLVAVGTANTPVLAIPTAIFYALHIWRTKQIRHVIGLVAAVGLILGENAWRKGGMFVTGYENDGAGPGGLTPYLGKPGFSYPFLLGLASILFSFGRGIMWYAPGLWAVRTVREEKSEVAQNVVIAWLVYLLGMIAAYSKWWAWHGAVFWGPRFFLFASIPAAYLIAVRLTKSPDSSLLTNLFALVLLVASFWVGTSGIYFRYEHIPPHACPNDGLACLYAPELSPLTNRLIYPKPLDARMIKMTYAPVVALVFLAVPLLFVIARQTFTNARDLARIVFKRQTWSL